MEIFVRGLGKKACFLTRSVVSINSVGLRGFIKLFLVICFLSLGPSRVSAKQTGPLLSPCSGELSQVAEAFKRGLLSNEMDIDGGLRSLASIDPEIFSQERLKVYELSFILLSFLRSDAKLLRHLFDLNRSEMDKLTVLFREHRNPSDWEEIFQIYGRNNRLFFKFLSLDEAYALYGAIRLSRASLRKEETLHESMLHQYEVIQKAFPAPGEKLDSEGDDPLLEDLSSLDIDRSYRARIFLYKVEIILDMMKKRGADFAVKILDSYHKYYVDRQDDENYNHFYPPGITDLESELKARLTDICKLIREVSLLSSGPVKDKLESQLELQLKTLMPIDFLQPLPPKTNWKGLNLLQVIILRENELGMKIYRELNP